MTALIVTDASGNLVSESSKDDVGYESLAANLKEAPVLEVAAHPLKSYTARIALADDSVADIGCVARRDGEGIVVAVRHQSAKRSRAIRSSCRACSMVMRPSIAVTS